MVARYKRKRHIEKNCLDAKPKHVNFEKSERQATKKEVRERLAESDYLTQDRLDAEADIKERMDLGYWCWQMEQADPNYVCRCFEKEEES
jgi:hypothetical protein